MSYTKAQIIQYMQNLDAPTLERLRKYAEYMIIPDEDTIVNATMVQMVEKAHSLADSLFPEWKDRSKSDFGEFLVQLFAYFSEKDFWYINTLAKEGILSKMTLYSNAFTMACVLGYTPILCNAASATFSVRFSAGDAITYGRGELTISSGDTHFTNVEPFVVNTSVSDADVNLILREGKNVYEDIPYNGNCVFLRRKNIDIGSISVVIDNVAYTRVGFFGASSPSSTHYMVVPEEDGSCSVYFGNDGHGVQPPLGKVIHVGYLTCEGSKGNVSASDASVDDSLHDRQAVSAVMLTSSDGGTDPESLTSIKQKAPIAFHGNRTVVNSSIAEEILESYPFVHRAKVTSIGNIVSYRVIPTSGLPEPSQKERQYIEDNFFPLLMLGYTGSYVQNSYVDLVMRSDMYATGIILDLVILKGYESSVIESSVRQCMRDFTDPMSEACYGGSLTKMSAEISMRSRVRGLQGVTFSIVLPDGTESPMPDIYLEDYEIFTPVSDGDLTIRTHVV